MHLLASGVSDPKERAAYLKKFNALVADAKKATAGAKSPEDKADRLLRFLHKGVMCNKYCAAETTLSRVFDAGKFNCVSSSSLYFLVGTRLGLKLQPVLIEGNGFSAGHAAVDLLVDGKRIEIEPTNPDGFDWPAKIKRPGVVVLAGPPDRKNAFDADGFGLAASIASNLGAGAKGADALRHLVVALVLSPTDPASANNTSAAVVNWGLDLSRAEKYEAALKVYSLGRSALGDDKKMEKNSHAIWFNYLDKVFGAEQFEAGLKLLPRAAETFPNDKAFAEPAEWVRRAAQRKADKSGWAAGFALADRALKFMTGDDAKAVRGWKAQGRRMWSQDHIRKGEIDESLTVLTDGLAESPDDKELLAGLTFHTQEALAILSTKKGTAAAVAHFETVRDRFPKNAAVADMGFQHAGRSVEAVCKDKKFKEALAAADAYKSLAGDRAGELKARVFDRWGRSLAADGEWEAAVAKYLEGLAAAPKDRNLSNNVIVLIDRWAGKSIDTKNWAAAIAVYETGLKHFPDNSHLKNNRDYCLEQQKK